MPHEDMGLVCVINLPELHLATCLKLKQIVQPIRDDGLVKAGGKFVGLLHRSGACQA